NYRALCSYWVYSKIRRRHGSKGNEDFSQLVHCWRERLMALLYSSVFGVAVFIITYHYCQRFLDWLRFQSLGTRDYIVEKLGLMFVDITPNRALLYLVAASVVPFVVVFLVCLPKVIPGLLFGSLAA